METLEFGCTAGNQLPWAKWGYGLKGLGVRVGQLIRGWEWGGEGVQRWSRGGPVWGCAPWRLAFPGLRSWRSPESRTDGSEHALGHGNVARLESHWPWKGRVRDSVSPPAVTSLETSRFRGRAGNWDRSVKPGSVHLNFLDLGLFSHKVGITKGLLWWLSCIMDLRDFIKCTLPLRTGGQGVVLCRQVVSRLAVQGC